MTLHHWKGPGRLERVDNVRATQPEVTEPSSPDVPGTGKEPERYLACTACGGERKYRKSMHVARHFNTQHEELREDSDSWRDHVREVWE